MINQAKIDLAVLLKLFQHSEEGGEAERPVEIAHLFQTTLSMRRVEVALQELERRDEVVREYHPHYEEGLWQISREGMHTVEKAMKLPSSFIARLNANGDAWFESEEAQNASLSKLPRYQDNSGGGSDAPPSAGKSSTNSVARARNEMLIAMVVEAAKGTANIPDLEELAVRHNIKTSPALAKSSIATWDEKGYLIISRLLDGTVAAAIKPSQFADALEEVIRYLKSTFFEVDWSKQEILTDSDPSIVIPSQAGWKILYAERDDAAPANQSNPPGVSVPITIQNTFSPVNNNPAQAGSERKSFEWSGWTNALVAFAVGVGGILATLWVAGKL